MATAEPLPWARRVSAPPTRRLAPEGMSGSATPLTLREEGSSAPAAPGDVGEGSHDHDLVGLQGDLRRPREPTVREPSGEPTSDCRSVCVFHDYKITAFHQPQTRGATFPGKGAGKRRRRSTFPGK